MATFQTTSLGIVQADVLIRKALLAAIDDIRQNPWLLDYAFAWLLSDDATSQEYGRTEVDRAKTWILNTDITVGMAFKLTDPKFPYIAIRLVGSNESESTMGDVNYQPAEDVNPESLGYTATSYLLGPFTPISYDKTTGTIVLPSTFTTDTIFEGALVLDPKINVGYQISEVTGLNSFTIAPNLDINLTKVVIAPYDNLWKANLESCAFRENYEIACYTQGDQVYTNYMTTLVQFILLRYKEQYLEGRGYERTTLSMGGLQPYTNMPGGNTGDVVYSRAIQITGTVRHFWPKFVGPKVQGIVIYGGDGTQSVCPGFVFVGFGSNDEGWIPGENEDEQPF